MIADGHLNVKAIAAKIDRVDRECFKSVVKPLLSDPLIEHVGEIGEGEKNEFLGNAYAMLFPIDWSEPCHEVFEKRFTARRMAHDYVEVYKKLIEAGRKRAERSAA